MAEIHSDNRTGLNLWIYNQIKWKRVGMGPRPHLEARRNLCVVSEEPRAVTCEFAAQLRFLTVMSNPDSASSFTASFKPSKAF